MNSANAVKWSDGAEHTIIMNFTPARDGVGSERSEIPRLSVGEALSLWESAQRMVSKLTEKRREGSRDGLRCSAAIS